MAGIAANAASPPIPGATLQVEFLVAYCESLEPCNAAILISAKKSNHAHQCRQTDADGESHAIVDDDGIERFRRRSRQR